MYCPNCGTAEQTPNSYCRNCGEFFSDPNKLSRMSFGGDSPQQNVNAINILSLIAAIVSLLVGLLMYLTAFNVPLVLYLAAAILLCNAGWHFSNFVVGRKLKKRLSGARKESSASDKDLPPAKIQESLPEAKFEDYISPSITENTTKHLSEKIRRKSS